MFINAEMTAKNRKARPATDAVSLKSPSRTMMQTPAKETKNPNRLTMENLSRNIIKPSQGVKTGIVATITDAKVAVTYFNPKLSPIKNKKGEKKLSIIKSL